MKDLIIITLLLSASILGFCTAASNHHDMMTATKGTQYRAPAVVASK